MRAVCVSHPLVRGIRVGLSACPDGAPTFLRTGSTSYPAMKAFTTFGVFSFDACFSRKTKH
eukprot:3357715-Prymnesium_polylepis.1